MFQARTVCRQPRGSDGRQPLSALSPHENWPTLFVAEHLPIAATAQEYLRASAEVVPGCGAPRTPRRVVRCVSRVARRRLSGALADRRRLTAWNCLAS